MAKHMDKRGKTKTHCGTIGYMAPEIVWGESYGYEADIWSLGVLFCEMVGGLNPFMHDNPMRVFESISAGKPIKWPKGLKLDIKHLLASILELIPTVRPSLEEIKSNPFFESVDWEKAKKADQIVPFVPEVVSCPSENYTIKKSKFEEMFDKPYTHPFS